MVIGDDFVSRKVASKDSESKRRLRLRECQCLVSLADVTQVSAVSRLGLKAALYTPPNFLVLEPSFLVLLDSFRGCTAFVATVSARVLLRSAMDSFEPSLETF